MAKNKEISNALGDLLGTTPTPTPKVKTGENNSNPSEEPKKDVNRNFTFRMSDSDRALLEKHFKEKGIINLSIGIRQMIADYMKENKLK